MNKVVLLNAESNILRSVAGSNKTVELILKTRTEIHGNMAVMADARQCREIVDVLTDLLAKSGFDIDYSPTNEGSIIEDLIDKFLVYVLEPDEG